MDIVENLDRHIRQLAPHIAQRETGRLLRGAMCELKRMRDLLDIAYDHLRGAGYEEDGVTLKQIETGCNPAPNK